MATIGAELCFSAGDGSGDTQSGKVKLLVEKASQQLGKVDSPLRKCDQLTLPLTLPDGRQLNITYILAGPKHPITNGTSFGNFVGAARSFIHTMGDSTSYEEGEMFEETFLLPSCRWAIDLEEVKVIFFPSEELTTTFRRCKEQKASNPRALPRQNQGNIDLLTVASIPREVLAATLRQESIDPFYS